MNKFQHIRKAFIFSLLAIMAVSFSACQEDEYADWKIVNDQWLEQHKNDPGFIQTESGLCYKIIHQTNLRQPNNSSLVDVDYVGKLVDGTVFDSGNFENYLYNAIPGWQEGVRKMREGARFIFYIPSSLGYGVDGSGDIPPNSTLIFEVTLNSSQY